MLLSVNSPNKQYCKHYFVGSERIATQLGDKELSIFEESTYLRIEAANSPSNKAQQQVVDLQLLLKAKGIKKISFAPYKKANVTTETAKSTTAAPTITAENATRIYFFHNDHLGTSTILTDGSGNPYQFFLNLPFGETMFEQHSYTEDYNNPYKFNGKELDEETGFYYYGARYYDPKISLWLSIDPLAEKLPHASPYAYCLNNPINAVDPDGRFPILPILLWKATGYLMEKFGQNANVKTAGYAMNHPINAVKTGTADIPSWGISKIASNFEVNLRNEALFTSGEGSQGNAYRHTLWQSILTNEFEADQAKRIGNNHEDKLPINMNQRNFAKMDAADQMADLLNNEIGRKIGEKNKGANNQELSVKVLKEYKQNGLWTVSGDKKTGYKVQKTKLSQEQYKKALEVLKRKGENGLNR